MINVLLIWQPFQVILLSMTSCKKLVLMTFSDIGKVMSCVVVETVKNIERESNWWYLACGKCKYPAKQQTVPEKDEYGEVCIHVYQQGGGQVINDENKKNVFDKDHA
ncbi:hypothetical protein Tco_0172568 [Tanacetum coccineum]